MDLQIVNGGQTTASLARAKIKDASKANLSKIWWCVRKYAEEIKEGDSQSKMIYLRL